MKWFLYSYTISKNFKDNLGLYYSPFMNTKKPNSLVILNPDYGNDDRFRINQSTPSEAHPLYDLMYGMRAGSTLYGLKGSTAGNMLKNTALNSSQ